MEVEYNNLHTHFVFTTLNRMPLVFNINQIIFSTYGR
jgi:hypothetical protein